MRIDNNSHPDAQPLRMDYWDIPEIATLLRLVTHLNIGGAIGLCLWVAAHILGLGAHTAMAGETDTRLTINGCQCEMRLVPMPPAAWQIADAGGQSGY